MSAASGTTARTGFTMRLLDGIERTGNRIPHPFWLFLLLGGAVLVLSLVLSAIGVSVRAPTGEGTVEVVNLLSVEGLRRIVSEAIKNFTAFPPLGIVLVVMMGVAVAEGSGLISTGVRSVVTTVSGRWLTFAVALTGITGSVASDAVIIVLPRWRRWRSSPSAAARCWGSRWPSRVWTPASTRPCSSRRQSRSTPGSAPAPRSWSMRSTWSRRCRTSTSRSPRRCSSRG